MGLLDTLADRLDVFISDLRLWCTLPAFGIMLEMDNHLYPYLNGTGRWPICLEGHALFLMCRKQKNIYSR